MQLMYLQLGYLIAWQDLIIAIFALTALLNLKGQQEIDIKKIVSRCH